MAQIIIALPLTMMYFGKSRTPEHNNWKEEEVNHRVILILTRGRRRERENPLEDGKWEYRISRTASLPLTSMQGSWLPAPPGSPNTSKARGGYRPLRLFHPDH